MDRRCEQTRRFQGTDKRVRRGSPSVNCGVQIAAKGSDSLDLAMATDQSVRPLLGVKVVGHGKLEVEELGHHPGTDYVVIQADCVDVARMACEELSPIARIPKDSWHGTWMPKRVSGQYVLERKIFPTLESVTA